MGEPKLCHPRYICSVHCYYLANLPMSYAKTTVHIGNINPKSLIIDSLRFYNRKLEFAEVDYHRATLNHDYRELERTQGEINFYRGIIVGYRSSLRLLLAQEAEASGRRVSASMSEFDEVIEELVDGQQNL